MSVTVEELYNNPKYDLGNCLVRVSNDDELYGYVNIPKNASCFAKVFWDGAVPLNFKKEDATAVKEFAVILRDPLRRWISGVAQALNETVRSPDSHNWDEVFDQVVLDNHTIPQVKYLEGLDLNRAVWFRAENDLQTALSEYAADKFKLIRHDFEQMREYGAFNISTDKPTKQRIVEYLKTLLSMEPAYKQRVLDFYKEDIELYNTVSYYNKEQ